MKYIFLIFLLLFLPASSMAAEFHFDRNPTSPVREGDVFSVQVSFETRIDVINAIEGTLRFPSSLALTDVHFQNSVVPIWISSPTEKEKGVVSFAGLLPGGYQGRGTLLTLMFKALKKDAAATISFGSDSVVYKNDGQGTKAVSVFPKLQFSIDAASGSSNTVSAGEDTTPPEPFEPTVSLGEPFGIDGPVLIFAAQDKHSGIARYELARSYVKGESEIHLVWKEVKSPYVFGPGDNVRYLYVRAIDRAGNTRIESISPQTFSSIAFIVAWWPLIMLGIIAVLIARFRRSFKRVGRV